jgi:RNA 3'-terminal phosphate cyclase-like protein
MPVAMASSSSSSRPKTNNKNQVQYRGHAHFRQRIVLSVLSGKSVRIDGIRADQLEVGVKGEGVKRWLSDISRN